MLEFDNGSIAVPECLVSRLDFDLACFWKCCDSLVKRPRKLPGLDTVDGSIKQVFLCRFASVVNCVCQHILNGNNFSRNESCLNFCLTGPLAVKGQTVATCATRKQTGRNDMKEYGCSVVATCNLV
jgi:hypothetical protein|eukprot:5644788-Pyramimonas_sp.AAC.1